MSTRPYYLTIAEKANPARSIEARLGDTPPTPSAGGGGWQPVTLPKRSAVSVWMGRDQLLSMAVPVVLGGGPVDGRAIFPAQGLLMEWWRPTDATTEPAVLKLDSPGSSVPFQRLPWVLSDFQWGDATGDESGSRVMQRLTLTLGEYRADERLQMVKVKKKQKTWFTGGHHTTHKGDTLRKLANDYAVDGGWQALAAAQIPPLQDPNQLRVGQDLVIPRTIP